MPPVDAVFEFGQGQRVIAADAGRILLADSDNGDTKSACVGRNRREPYCAGCPAHAAQCPAVIAPYAICYFKRITEPEKDFVPVYT
jgi:hypothetical protein